ncbi:MAG TPA: hypothetical protein VFQ88_05670 [Nevskiaceae bacterium]|nr:hypothetical protein [Nevskiaceae bacterium]
MTSQEEKECLLRERQKWIALWRAREADGLPTSGEVRCVFCFAFSLVRDLLAHGAVGGADICLPFLQALRASVAGPQPLAGYATAMRTLAQLMLEQKSKAAQSNTGPRTSRYSREYPRWRQIVAKQLQDHPHCSPRALIAKVRKVSKTQADARAVSRWWQREEEEIRARSGLHVPANNG